MPVPTIWAVSPLNLLYTTTLVLLVAFLLARWMVRFAQAEQQRGIEQIKQELPPVLVTSILNNEKMIDLWTRLDRLEASDSYLEARLNDHIVGNNA